MKSDKPSQSDASSTRENSARATAKPCKFLKWPTRLRLFRRYTLLCPTWTGSFCIAATFFILVVAWLCYGESYLSLTHRRPADILVVEGWIGRKGLRAAVDEFKRGRYRYIVATGGLTSGRWEDEPASYAVMAANEMIRSGVPRDKIIVATSDNTESHRTFESAVAVWRGFRDANMRLEAVNVFTLGPHASRSLLVFSKVLGPKISVGVIGWLPSDYKTEPWWRSSERSRELLEETVGYLYEVLLNSGRQSNAPEIAARN